MKVKSTYFHFWSTFLTQTDLGSNLSSFTKSKITSLGSNLIFFALV